MIFNPYSIVPFISGMLAFSVSLVAYRHNPSSRIHQLFFWLCVSVCLWPLSLSIFLNLSDPRAIILWTKVGHTTCTIGPAVFFDFVITILKKERLRRISQIYYGFAIFYLFASWLNDGYFPGEVSHYAWGPYAIAGPLVFVDAVIATMALLISWALLFRACRVGKHTLPAIEYNKLRYLTTALTFFSLGMVDYLPKYGIPILPIGSVFIATFALIVAYAIIRHQLLDITIAMRRTVVYSILVGLITVVYFAFVLIAEKLLQGVMGYRSLIGSIVSGVVIALGFIPVRNAIQQWVDTLFFGGSQVALAKENERLRQELTRTEKLKSISTLAAGMAHEIKNPLAAIKIFSECMPERYDDPDFREKFARIMTHEVRKINDLVQRLLDFAKPMPPKPQPTRLARLIDETLEFLDEALVRKQIRIVRAYAVNDTALVDAGQIRQVLLNVLLNSIEAMEKPGAITVTTLANNGCLEVIIADTGPGIPKERLGQVCDPFYTTKPTGTGLGLSVVHSIIKEHGGRVTLSSALGQGTTVRMQLPIAKEEGSQ